MTSRVQITVDPGGAFGRTLTALERQQVPFATRQAINATAFETRQRWSDVMPKIFDNPTPLTRRAVLYNKATRSRLVSDIFIRDEAFKGTPPAKYLLAQVEGGARRPKGAEKRLQAAGILPAGQFIVPGRGAQLDAYGNLPGKQFNAILSQLGARFDPIQNETAESRGRRVRRESRKGQRRGDFFALRKPRGRLKAGVYQRVSTGFGSTVRSILQFVQQPRYRRRYDIFGIAQKIYDRRFAANFQREFAKAMASAGARR